MWCIVGACLQPRCMLWHFVAFACVSSALCITHDSVVQAFSVAIAPSIEADPADVIARKTAMMAAYSAAAPETGVTFALPFDRFLRFLDCLVSSRPMDRGFGVVFRML